MKKSIKSVFWKICLIWSCDCIWAYPANTQCHNHLAPKLPQGHDVTAMLWQHCVFTEYVCKKIHYSMAVDNQSCINNSEAIAFLWGHNKKFDNWKQNFWKLTKFWVSFGPSHNTSDKLLFAGIFPNKISKKNQFRLNLWSKYSNISNSWTH